MPDKPGKVLLFPKPKARPVSKPKPAAYFCAKDFQQVLCFKVTLQDVAPVVWRRLELPDCSTFWDLHVAISDAFDWLDYHLHEFEILNPQTGEPARIGSPDEEELPALDGESSVESDRTRALLGLFSETNRQATYCYDFGDGWEHLIELEAIQPKAAGTVYPRCTAGEMAAPPDDCGGPPGYATLLQALRDPRQPAHRDMIDWLRMMKGNGFNPTAFDPAAVHFDDPDKRWKLTYEGGEMTPDLRGWAFFKRQGGGRR